ncbi:MAG TPA: hypothetical protein VJJ52_00205 [Candidatus Nanoarchaeia archaeon]|nr:hypothetical protein [Candidatus Nanoarchaeia archaeon]
MEENCCESGSGGCCSNEAEGKCGCSGESNCCEKSYDKMGMMMWLAHSAKMELIKEKMKKKLEAAKGKKLDQVAELFVDAMMEKYKDEAESEKKKEELQQKFDAIFEKE